VLAPSRNGGIFCGQVWTFASSNGVAFEFTPSRKAEEIAASFAVNWGRFKLVEDYKGYAWKVTEHDATQQLVPDEPRPSYMMHVRRKFHEAFELNDARAAEALQLSSELYRIEAADRRAALSFDAPHTLRQAQ
jgi:hypothetical protein